MMTVDILCGFLPSLLVAPFAGVWAHRFNRKFLMATADALIAVATLVLAILFLMGYGSVWLLFGVSAVRSLGAGIHMPAIGAFLPQIVPQEKLARVNAINGTIQSTLTLLTPMLGAAILTVASIEAILFIDVVTAAIAITILLVFLRVPSHSRAKEGPRTGYFADLRKGIAYIARHDYLKAFFLFYSLYFVFLGPVAYLTPPQVARSFGEEVWRQSATQLGFSVGTMLGGLLLAWWGGLLNKVHGMALASFILGLCVVILGIPPAFGVYVALMVLIGIAVPMFHTSATVLLQEKVDDSFRGRVFGVNSMIPSSLVPLSMLVYGPLADVYAVESLLLVAGTSTIVKSLLMLANRALRQAGAPALPPSSRRAGCPAALRVRTVRGGLGARPLRANLYD